MKPTPSICYTLEICSVAGFEGLSNPSILYHLVSTPYSQASCFTLSKLNTQSNLQTYNMVFFFSLVNEASDR